jgi:AmmeMemoRadiSam system protein A
MTAHLTETEKKTLLSLAREALERGVRGEMLPALDLNPATLTPALRAEGSSFVTLTENGELRGCVGALEPYQPLAEDVREHAIAAALQDYRFPRVQLQELPHIKIEISRLTVPEPLAYGSPEELLAKIRPGVDGVMLRDGRHKATFLPQVWGKIPDKVEFMEQLCAKIGAERDLWQRKHFDVLLYQVEEFHE